MDTRAGPITRLWSSVPQGARDVTAVAALVAFGISLGLGLASIQTERDVVHQMIAHTDSVREERVFARLRSVEVATETALTHIAEVQPVLTFFLCRIAMEQRARDPDNCRLVIVGTVWEDRFDRMFR